MSLSPISPTQSDQASAAVLWTEEKNRLLRCCTFGVCLWTEPRHFLQTGIPTAHDKLSRSGDSKARTSCRLQLSFFGGSPLWVDILSITSKENCELSVAHLASISSSMWTHELVLVSVQPGLDAASGEQPGTPSRPRNSMLCFLSKSTILGIWVIKGYR